MDALKSALEKSAETILGRAQKKRVACPDQHIRELSMRQKALRVQINAAVNEANRTALRRERMLLLRQIHKATLCARRDEIDSKVKEIENAKDNTKMFLATKQAKTWVRTAVIIDDDKRREIKCPKEKAQKIAAHFRNVFYSEREGNDLPPFVGDPRPLSVPISMDEINLAICRLRPRRAPGPDGLPAELFKASMQVTAQALVYAFNEALQNHQPLSLGSGVLIPLPKPAKPRGLCSSLRPVMLLDATRKVLSNVVAKRIRPKFEALLPPGQAGSRPGRSTSDGVWVKRMCVAIAAHYNIEIHSLGTDIRAAFDSVDRARLLMFFEEKRWMTEDEIRITRFLMAGTSFRVRVEGAMSDSVPSNMGVLQGDGLSVIIFIGYLAGAVYSQQVRSYPSRPSFDDELKIPFETSYVDDVDFYSVDPSTLEDTLKAVEENFRPWGFEIAVSKTERTKVCLDVKGSQCAKCSKRCIKEAAQCDCCLHWWHYVCAALTDETIERFETDPNATFKCERCASGEQPSQAGEEKWRKAKHLGSLIDSAEDVKMRIQRAWGAFSALAKIWARRHLVNEKRRVRLFNAFVLPHLTYNIAVQALTRKLAERLDVAQRRMLRRIVGVFYPEIISNAELYRRTETKAISELAKKARWKYLGHVLRRGDQTPCWGILLSFFEAKLKLKRRPFPVAWTLLDVLAHDLKESETRHAFSLASVEDCHLLKMMAEDRRQWEQLVESVCED